MTRQRLSLVAGVTLTGVTLFAALPATQGQAPATAPTQAQGPRFTTLPGFSIERVVPASKLDSYVVITFDSQGRLFVSKEYDHPRLLLDNDKDGIYESEKVFSDKVRNCQGLWFDGPTLYGACAPFDSPIQGGPPPAPGTKPAPQTSGLYKMTDTNGDDVADTFEQFSGFVGGIQEHGPHAIRRGPDGIPTIMVGNNTFYPDEMVNPTSPLGGPGTPNPSRESQFLPALPDGRGFGPSVKEGLHGTIARIDEDTKQYTLLVGGLRNAYDHAFNLAGEIFTFDSDMEWDINMPWYRDVRTVHGIPGGNYGYRNGSGKFPPYFIDSLPAVRDLGRGSPVGVEFYQHTVYPKEFRDAYFEADWSRGRLLWTGLERTGATYKATKEKDEFVHGEPLNITDVEVGPDGLIYFSIGGRGTEGGIYRVKYTGASTNGAPENSTAAAPSGVLAVVRQPQPLSSWGYAAIEKAKASMGASFASELEALARETRAISECRAQAVYILQRHGAKPGADLLKTLIADKDPMVRAAAVFVAGAQKSDDAKAVAAIALKDADPFVRRRAAEALVRQGLSADKPPFAPVADVYALLNDADRFVRYSGRMALERMPRAEWAPKVLVETNATGAIEGALALVETATSDVELESVLNSQLALLQKPSLSVEDKLRALRVFQLAVIESKQVTSSVKRRAHTALIEQFPSKDERLNRQLANTLAWAGQPAAITKILAAMPKDNADQQLQLHYVHALRTVKDGWTPAQKTQMMDWYAKAITWRGGASFPGFINLFFDASLQTFTPEEKKLAYEKVPQFAPLTEQELAASAQRMATQRAGQQRPANLRARGVLAISKEELVEELIFTPQRQPPSAQQGREVYEKACSACHRFGAIGTDIGPDLTTLNSRFQKKDIVESILWPSRVISDQYDVTMVQTKDGKAFAGFVVREESGKLVMRTADTVGRSFEVAAANIKSKDKSPVSMMPEGLVDEFSLGQIHGLIKFLQSDPPK
jgi:putative heme-binding domain-containing protein